jgi:hypothetical protein
MKFYRIGEIPARSDDQVFKTSPTGPFIWFIVFSGIGIALLLLGIGGAKIYGLHQPPVFFIYAGAAFFGLFGWICLGQFRACMKPTNWLLRCNGSGVIIKYRSFQNWRFPAEDEQVVGFDYSEIAWARTVRERRTSLDLAGKRQSQVFDYLDFCLANADTAALEAHLQAEQKAEPPGRFKTITRDYPVEVLPGGMVQVRWNGIRPSPKKAIQYLSRHLRVAAADSTKVDLTPRSNPGPGEEDAKILKLARSGDRIGTVNLARRIYGSTLTEAVAFVEKLQSGD